MRRFFAKKGDSRHASRARWLLALPLLAVGCGHGVTLTVPQQERLTSRAHLAENECQRRCNASDSDRCEPADDACLNLARAWLKVSR